MAERELAILLTARDRASRTIKGVKKELGGFDKAMGRVGKGTSAAMANIERGVTLGAAAIVGGLGYSVKVAGDFEAQMNTINTVAQLTPDLLAGVGDGIRAMSRATGTATSDLTAAYYDLVSAGVKAGDAQGVLTAANTLAIGGLATTAETVDLLTTALNTYGGGAAEAADYADYFAQSVAAGKVTAAEIAQSFAQVGPLAKSSGIEIQELAAGYAQLTAKGVPAAEAATSMRAAMIALIRTTGPMEKLQKKLNVNFADLAAEKGLAEAYQVLRDGAEEYDVPLIELVGRQEALAYALNTTDENAVSYADNLKKVNEATDGVGVAADQAAERQKGFAYQMAIFKANVNDAAVTLGTALLPAMTDLAKEASTWIQGNQPEIKAFAKDLAAGIKDAVGFLKSVNWDAVGSALMAGANGAKMIAQAFLSLPPGIQAFLATGFVANKFTGGVIGDVLGDVVKGAIKGVLGINAGVVNINAGRVLGGGLPGAAGAAPAAGAGAAAAGGVKGALSKALGILGVVAAAGIADELDKGLDDFGPQLRAQLLGQNFPKLDMSDMQWPFGPANTPTILPEIFGGNGALGGAPAPTPGRGSGGSFGAGMPANRPATKFPNAIGDPDVRQSRNDWKAGIANVVTKQNATTTAVESMRSHFGGLLSTQTAKTSSGLSRLDAAIARGTTASQQTKQAALETKREAQRGLSLVNSSARTGLAITAATTRSTVNANAQTVAGAIRANRPSLSTSVVVNISGSGVTSVQTSTKRTGGTGASRNTDTRAARHE